MTVSGGHGGSGADVPNSVEDLRSGSDFVNNKKMEAASVMEIKLKNELVTRLLVIWIKVIFIIVLAICLFLISLVSDNSIWLLTISVNFTCSTCELQMNE